ncbi:MAG: TonB-dependent receptor plug domain-containing protein, partial [Porticoccaceae bacterium]|nr:TonB-dependent receptor plug domain-containing protein [Porticoccaceae bacterium]
MLVGLLLTEGALADAVAKASGLDGVTSPHSAVTALDKVLGASTSTTLASENVVVQTFAQEETAEDADDKEVDEEIIATGTRLKNSAFAGVSPVQVLTPEISQLSGSFEASDLIRSTSLATGSFQLNQQLGAVAPGGSVGNGGGGVNGISLRGLGTNRTLVVLDGRRLSPAGVQGSVGAVDLNTLPSSALARVEIVKDGSSSVYGADAVAGVINGITKKNYDGGSVDFSVNVPTEGEGE